MIPKAFKKYNVIGKAIRDETPEIKTTSGKRTFTMASLNRLTSDWISTAQSINFDLHQGLSVMRARGREMAQNDPIAKKFVHLIKKNVIGPNGFTLKVKSYDWVSQKDDTGKLITKQVFDRFANRLLQDKFWYWSKKKNCTVQENSSFRETCELALTTACIDGESFTVHLKGKGYGGRFGYTTQLVDANLVDEKYNRVLSQYERMQIQKEQGGEVGTYIQMGIEYNNYRKPTAYYFRKQNPYDEIFYSGYALGNDYARLPAENVIHLFVKEFVNQGRGISWFAPAALRLHMLNKTSEAAVIAFRIGASKTLLLEQQENADPSIEEAEAAAEGGSDPYGNILEPVEPGETYKIPYGYKAVNYDPQFPNSEFGSFTETILQQVASGWDTSHPSLTSNYKGTTWTSSRTALIDERDGWERMQHWFAEHYLDDVYANWLYMILLSNQVPLPATKFEKFDEAFWYGRDWEWVDPEKEVNAQIKEFQYKFSTFAEILGRKGIDLEEHLEEIADEQKMFEKYGIEFPADIPEDTKPNKEQKPEEEDDLLDTEKIPKNGKEKIYHEN